MSQLEYYATLKKWSLLAPQSMFASTICLNSLRPILVRAGTENSAGRTFQVGTYLWRELTHDDFGPPYQLYVRRNCL